MSNERRVPSALRWGIVSLLIAHCSVLIAGTGSLSQQAELAWQNRDKPGQTEQAIQLWEQALKAEPSRTEILIPLTRACGRAVRHASTTSDSRRWSERALEYGKNAVEKNPPSSDAYAYYAEALGQWAQAHKGVHSLKSVRLAVDSLKTSITLNPKNSYAHMLLSSFYRESPSVISVGDKHKALEEAELAVHTGPQYAIDHIALAKIDLDLGKKEEGIAQLQQVMSLNPPSDAVPETQADQKTAAAMLHELGASPTPKQDSQAIPKVSSCDQNSGYCSEAEHP